MVCGFLLFTGDVVLLMVRVSICAFTLITMVTKWKRELKQKHKQNTKEKS